MSASQPMVKTGPSRAGAEYLKIRDLASGGMGSVELARAISGIRAGQPVVLKRLHPHLEREQQFVAMLLDEAWITAGLHHPNIVEMYDMGQDASGHFLVLEFVAGDSLLSLIRESKKLQIPIPLEITLYITAKIAEGLHAAHELRNERGELVHLVHRDVTPSNILLGMQGEVKLIDFGVAKSLERLSHTSTGTIKGKFGYMSPEQARGLAIDRRSDLFSLGVVLWEMLAQRRLYRSESELELLRMVVEEPAPPIRTIRPDAPASLERLLNAALAKNRDDRLGSCGEFGDFLWEAFTEVHGHTGARELAAFFKRVLPLRCTELAQLLIEVEEFSAPRSVVRSVMQSFTDLPISAAETEAPVVFDSRDAKARASLPFASTMLAGPSNPPPAMRAAAPSRSDAPATAALPLGPPVPSSPPMGTPVGGVALGGPAVDPSRPPRLLVVQDSHEGFATAGARTEPPPAEEPIHPTFLPAKRSPVLLIAAALGLVGIAGVGAAVALRSSSHSVPQVHTTVLPTASVNVSASTVVLPSASETPSAAATGAAMPSSEPTATGASAPTASATALPSGPEPSATASAVVSAQPEPSAPTASAQPSSEPTALATAVAATAEPSASGAPAVDPNASAARSPRGRRTNARPSAQPGISFDDVARSMLRDPNAVQRPPQ